MNVNDYEKRVQAITSANARFDVTTVAEAKAAQKQIVLAQKELRQVKKEMGLTMRDLRAQYADKKEDVSRGSFSKGVAQGLFGKKTVARADASQKDAIRQAQQKQLAPYEALAAHIDAVLLDYDRRKMQIDAWIAQQP
jgi:hypothetical protein